MNDIDIFFQPMFNLNGNSETDEKSDFSEFVNKGIKKASEISRSAGYGGINERSK